MTKDQERARAKRRHERQQAAAAAKSAQQGRTTLIGAVVAALAVLIVAAYFALSSLLGQDDQERAGTAPSTTSAPERTDNQDLADGCQAPPAAPGTGAELDAPDAAQIDAVRGKTVVARLETTCGFIELELDGAKAPETVASFAQLARLNYWKDAPCHRLVTSGIFVLQCGDPTGSGSGNPGYGYGIENAPEDGQYPRGTVAMARTNDPQSNGGQYFIVFKDTELPVDGGGYSIFGTVTRGLDIVDKIAEGGNASDGVAPRFPISTLTVTTETKD